MEQAIQIYDDLVQSIGLPNSLVKNGFLSQKTYINVLHELWRAIMNLGLDTALYYERYIDPKNAKNLQVNIPLIENALIRYLDFFARYVSKGYQSIVPDNAFYGAVEAAELLSEMHFLSAPWEKGMKKYDLALARRVQSLEIFPFDVKNYYLTARRLSELGRLEKYKKYVLLLAHRIHNSELIRASAVQKSRYMGNDLIKLQATIPEIIKRAPYNIVLQEGLHLTPQEMSKRLTLIQKATGTGAKSNPLDAQASRQIADMVLPLNQRLSAKKTFSTEETLSFIKDIDPLVALIDEKLKNATPQEAAEDKLPFGQDLFPSDLKQLSLELKQIKEESFLLSRLPDMSELRDTLVFEVDHPFHTLLRRFYHENSNQDLNYLRLLRGKAPKEPSALDPSQSKEGNFKIGTKRDQ